MNKLEKLEKLEKLITQKLIKIHSVDGKVVWKGNFNDAWTRDEINQAFEESIKNTAKVLLEMNSYSLLGMPTTITLHSSANYCYCDLEDYNDNCEDSLDEFLRSQVRYHPFDAVLLGHGLGRWSTETAHRRFEVTEPFYLFVHP